MNDVLFSIVIPTYNRAKFIRNTIDSLLIQSYENFEIIVVDDGSTDNTAEMVQSIEHPRVTYYPKANEERAVARNFGARKAKGNFVTFLDSDDYVYPQHLTEARDFLFDYPDAKVFHLAYEIKDDKGRLLRKVEKQKPINDNIIFGNSLATNGMFIERNTMLNNLFNEDRKLSALEDWELWIRLAAQFPIYHVNQVTSVLVQHDLRSVMTDNVTGIRDKVDTFCEHVMADQKNRAKYGELLKNATASAKTYAALHIAMTGKSKGLSWQYLRKGIADSTSQLFTKRSVVTLLFLLGLKRLR
jgi:glycosyltransferase involved in cell wall biosynthesis